MKFYGNGIVWDGTMNRTLCEFSMGELETEDNDIIEKLKSMGYSHEEIEAPVEVKQVKKR